MDADRLRLLAVALPSAPRAIPNETKSFPAGGGGGCLNVAGARHLPKDPLSQVMVLQHRLVEERHVEATKLEVVERKDLIHVAQHVLAVGGLARRDQVPEADKSTFPPRTAMVQGLKPITKSFIQFASGWTRRSMVKSSQMN